MIQEFDIMFLFLFEHIYIYLYTFYHHVADALYFLLRVYKLLCMLIRQLLLIVTLLDVCVISAPLNRDFSVFDQITAHV